MMKVFALYKLCYKETTHNPMELIIVKWNQKVSKIFKGIVNTLKNQWANISKYWNELIKGYSQIDLAMIYP